ncbi:MAG: DUF3540 domain-containing protein [Deltaproteobacteria bacterium]|nr:DUF3540 domain-containing protein [Deltaproteobacteria bacterium]
MEAVIDPTTDLAPASAATRATVTRVSGPSVQCRTRFGASHSAHVALPAYTPRVGDTVLLLADDEGAHHVVGVLASLRAVRDAGSHAPAFVYDEATGKTVFSAPGDLELVAPRGTVRLAAREVEVTAARSRWQSDRMEVVARTLSTVAERSTAVIGILDTRATRILEKARVAYREVEDLAQTRAGRIRQIAESTWQVLGKRALVKAEEDVKIQGEKIHLA